MAELMKLAEQIAQQHFKYDEIEVVYFGANKFDAVHRYNESKECVEQAMPDLETCINDCEEFKEVISQFAVKSIKEIWLKDPTFK